MEMYLISAGDDGGRKTSTGWSSTRRLLWVSAERDASGAPLVTRSPRPRRKSWPLKRGFRAAGRKYRQLSDLQAAETDADFIYRDRYGREVLLVLERFPCFDSFDALYENRFERWYLICENGVLTQVKYTDETNYIEVCEDVAELEYSVWRELRRLGWHMLRDDG